MAVVAGEVRGGGGGRRRRSVQRSSDQELTPTGEAGPTMLALMEVHAQDAPSRYGSHSS